jgi:FKBP-type peptidyl-prolyl cis-trans isomerase
MRTRTLLLALTACLLFGGTAQGQRRMRLRTTADSVAYYLGAYFAPSLKQMYEPLSIDFRIEAYTSAFEEVFNPRKASHLPEEEEVSAFLSEYFSVRVPAENLRASQEWLVDSIAYYLGLNFARQVKLTYEPLSIDFRIETFTSAFEEVFNPQKSSPLPEEEEVLAFRNDYFTVRVPAETLRASQEWLAEVERTTPGIQRTESGLLYRIVDPGDSMRATGDEDQVEVHYVGQLRDGTVVFDYSRERGETATYALRQVIPGCVEGLKLIGKGGTIQLWLPPHLAYGQSGTYNNNIPSNAALYYEVEIVDVISKKDHRS